MASLVPDPRRHPTRLEPPGRDEGIRQVVCASATTPLRTLSGTLIVEILNVESVIDVPLTITRLQRLASWPDSGSARWTIIDFVCPESHTDRLAEQLATSMMPGGYYADFATDSVKYVVFPNRTFRYRRDDEEARAAAQAHARRAGVPEARLQWPRARGMQRVRRAREQAKLRYSSSI